MKSKKWFILTGILVAVVMLIMVINVLKQDKSMTPLVQTKDYAITAKEFKFYKANVELLAELNQTASVSDDKTLLNDMIKLEETIQHAKELGIAASVDEVNTVIQNERNALSDPSVDGLDNQIVKEIMKNRIRITGLTDEDFWNSAEVRTQYEKAIIQGKLYERLVSEGEIKDMQGFNEMQDKWLQNATEGLDVFYKR